MQKHAARLTTVQQQTDNQFNIRHNKLGFSVLLCSYRELQTSSPVIEDKCCKKSGPVADRRKRLVVISEVEPR